VVQDETFQLMNVLDQCLRVSNSAVVLAACDAFLKLTNGMPEIQAQVYTRLKTPLLTLMAAATPELCHCVLSHIVRIVPRCSGVFDTEFKQFFCRYVVVVSGWSRTSQALFSFSFSSHFMVARHNAPPGTTSPLA